MKGLSQILTRAILLTVLLCAPLPALAQHAHHPMPAMPDLALGARRHWQQAARGSFFAWRSGQHRRWSPSRRSGGLGLGVAAVGLVMATGPVVSALTGIVAGRAVDRIGAPRAVLAGLAAMTLATLALATFPALPDWPGYKKRHNLSPGIDMGHRHRAATLL